MMVARWSNKAGRGAPDGGEAEMVAAWVNRGGHEMTTVLKVGDRFPTPWPGTVISLQETDGIVSCYEVRLDEAPEGETWLVPVAAVVPLGPAEEGPEGVTGSRPPGASP
ncbi:MAG: hypothetical protein WCP21_04640 [Armatimonadota bacterium]